MISFKVLPISSHYRSHTLLTRRDALEQPVRTLISLKGGEPLRCQLRLAKTGENLVLASHTPFSKPGPFLEYGPIYLLDDPSMPMASVQGSLPPDYFRAAVALRAYTVEEEIYDAAVVETHLAESVIARFLSNDNVEFLHARFPAYGCFACRIERN